MIYAQNNQNDINPWDLMLKMKQLKLSEQMDAARKSQIEREQGNAIGMAEQLNKAEGKGILSRLLGDTKLGNILGIGKFNRPEDFYAEQGLPGDERNQFSGNGFTEEGKRQLAEIQASRRPVTPKAQDQYDFYGKKFNDAMASGDTKGMLTAYRNAKKLDNIFGWNMSDDMGSLLSASMRPKGGSSKGQWYWDETKQAVTQTPEYEGKYLKRGMVPVGEEQVQQILARQEKNLNNPDVAPEVLDVAQSSFDIRNKGYVTPTDFTNPIQANQFAIGGGLFGSDNGYSMTENVSKKPAKAEPVVLNKVKKKKPWER